MQPDNGYPSKIVVVGVGNSGIATTNYMVDCNLKDVEYVVVGSDQTQLKFSKVTNRIYIREGITIGLGMITVEFAKALAEKNSYLIKERLQGADVVIVISGMGGGTGTGAAQVVAACAREIGALTIAIVTFPFIFEGRRRKNKAIEAVLELKNKADSIVVFPNESVVHYIGKHKLITRAFKCIDHVLLQATKYICNMVNDKVVVEAKNSSGLLPKECLIEMKYDKTFDEDDSQLENFDGLKIIITPTIIDELCSRDGETKFQKRLAAYITSIDSTLGGIPSKYMGLPEWRGKEKDKSSLVEDSAARSDGKKVCSYLKMLRLELAKANNIPIEIEECNYDGPCSGTCEKCDQEAAYLRDKLFEIPENKRIYPKKFLTDWNKLLCMEK